MAICVRRVPVIKNLNEFTVSIMNSWDVCLNCRMTIPIVWNELSDNMIQCCGMDFLSALRIVHNK